MIALVDRVRFLCEERRLKFSKQIFFALVCIVISEGVLGQCSKETRLKVDEFISFSKDLLKHRLINRCDALGVANRNKPIIVVFEGTGAYSPGTHHFYQGLSRFDLIEEYREIETAKDLKAMDDFQKVRSRYLRRSGTGTPEIAYALWTKHYELSKNFEILYYNRAGSKAALKCLESIQREKAKRNEELDLRVIGHSWGAFEAIEFTYRAQQKGMRAQKLLTVDPVDKRPAGLINNLLGSGDLRPFKQVPTPLSWTNLYQKRDRKSLLVGIKGAELEQADKNVEVLNYDLGASIENKSFAEQALELKVRQERGHLDIFNSEEASSALQSFLEAGTP